MTKFIKLQNQKSACILDRKKNYITCNAYVNKHKISRKQYRPNRGLYSRTKLPNCDLTCVELPRFQKHGFRARK